MEPLSKRTRVDRAIIIIGKELDARTGRRRTADEELIRQAIAAYLANPVGRRWSTMEARRRAGYGGLELSDKGHPEIVGSWTVEQRRVARRLEEVLLDWKAVFLEFATMVDRQCRSHCRLRPPARAAAAIKAVLADKDMPIFLRLEIEIDEELPIDDWIAKIDDWIEQAQAAQRRLRTGKHKDPNAPAKDYAAEVAVSLSIGHGLNPTGSRNNWLAQLASTIYGVRLEPETKTGDEGWARRCNAAVNKEHDRHRRTILRLIRRRAGENLARRPSNKATTPAE
jgi:hypothetical protein